MEAGAAVLNESVIYLPQVGSTNAWAKENIAQFGPVGAVYTTDQTAGRGRLGRGWVDAPGKGLYYTAVIKRIWHSRPRCRCSRPWLSATH